MTRNIVKFVVLISALVVLGFFVLVQLNDPDPAFWVMLYAISALVPVLSIVWRWSEPVFWTAVGFCLAGLTVSLPGAFEYLNHLGQESLLQDMSSEKPYIEEAREFLGTSIAFGLIVLCRFLALQYDKR